MRFKFLKTLCVLALPALVGMFSLASVQHGIEHVHSSMALSQAAHASVDSQLVDHDNDDDCSVFHTGSDILFFSKACFQVTFVTLSVKAQTAVRIFLTSYLIPHGQAPPRV